MIRNSALLLLAISLVLSTNINAQTTLKWSKNEKLKWSDYRANPDTNIGAAAKTTYKIEIQPTNITVDANNKIYNYEALTAVAYFFRNQSWVIEQKEDILLHEQLHFDIAELHAKKIRIEFRKLKEQKIADFNSYSNIYKKLWQACVNTQRKYDRETNHGILKEENKKWQQKISDQLNGI